MSILQCLGCDKLDSGFERKDYKELKYKGQKIGTKVRVCNKCGSSALVTFVSDNIDSFESLGA